MPVTLDPTRWCDWCMSEDEKKKQKYFWLIKSILILVESGKKLLK